MARAGPRRAYLLAGLLIAAQAAEASKAQSGPSETAVKAAFLPKFAAYVNWPPGALGAPDDPVQLCVIGRDPFGAALDETASRQRIDLHPIVVRRLESTDSAEHCHIAFLAGSPKQSIAAMLAAMRGQPALTVTDDGLGPERGIIHFTLKQGRVRFHIDEALAARGKLALSARLLGLAISVKPRSRA